MTRNIITLTEEFVKNELANNDASHDFSHIARVRSLAKSIAVEEKLSQSDVELVELAALLHDIDDWKYSNSETAGADKAEAFLRKHGLSNEICTRIGSIIRRVSFHSELGFSESEKTEALNDRVLCCVQDADRLDAIGAVGIARCFTYGGKKGRPFYNAESGMISAEEGDRIVSSRLSKEDYMGKGGTGVTIDHFYEKLLLLKNMMKTAEGRQRAEARHRYMQDFLRQFRGEVNGEL
eukprot:g2621.t1